MSEDQFIHLWHSPNPEVRLRALRAILTNPHTSGLITNDVLLGAFEALWGPGKVTVIDVTLLSDLYRLLRKVIADRRDPALVPALIHYLGSPEPSARSIACEWLGTIGDRRATEPIMRLLTDPIPFVQFDAIHALVQLGDPQAIPALQQLLASEYGRNFNYTSQLQYALRFLGDAPNSAVE